MSLINTRFRCPAPERVEGRQIPSLIARCAQLAMLLEVSASPKPGNVDREHNYPETCFEHFVASSVSAYPVLELAARSRNGIGSLIRSAVCESFCLATWRKHSFRGFSIADSSFNGCRRIIRFARKS